MKGCPRERQLEGFRPRINALITSYNTERECRSEIRGVAVAMKNAILLLRGAAIVCTACVVGSLVLSSICDNSIYSCSPFRNVVLFRTGDRDSELSVAHETLFRAYKTSKIQSPPAVPEILGTRERMHASS